MRGAGELSSVDRSVESLLMSFVDHRRRHHHHQEDALRQRLHRKRVLSRRTAAAAAGAVVAGEAEGLKGPADDDANPHGAPEPPSKKRKLTAQRNLRWVLRCPGAACMCCVWVSFFFFFFFFFGFA